MKDKRQKPKKVPTVLQMEALECGAASLAMILAYYGRWVPLEKLRADCGVSRNGAKASSILKAARTYGLDARGGKYSADLLKQKNEFPCIIHWNFSHFVVLCGFSRTKAVINDPANGTRTVPMKEFEESFTGICLFFSPNGDFIKEGHPKSGYSYIKNRLSGQKRLLTLILTAALCLAIAGVFGVLLSRVFLDELLPGVEEDMDRAMYVEQLRGKLADVLAQLPERQREVVKAQAEVELFHFHLAGCSIAGRSGWVFMARSFFAASSSWSACARRSASVV